jgi:flagellar biosynthesis protein FlhG
MSELFVKIKDKQRGPFSSHELKKLVLNGEFDCKDLVFHEETQEWIEAGKLDELQNLFVTQPEKEQQKIVYAIGGGKGGVGKTVLTASLGIGLAALGNKVVIVDADLGGANLHTCIGMLEPMYTFYHFYTLQKDKLEDIVLDTPIENLKLISGACGTLGLANPKFSQKIRFINELRQLNADVILVDLGAGSSYNVIDFFLAADQGILVTTPEPMAIQETFNFVKICILRKFFREFKSNASVFSILEREVLTQPGRMNLTVDGMLKEIRKIDSHAAVQMEQFLKEFCPHFILNMVHSADEIKEGDTLRTAAKELLSIDIDYIGFIDYDESVRLSVKELRPFIINNPKSRASRSLAKLITLGILGRRGWKGFKERRKVIKQIITEASLYPKTDLKENATICSVQCFYWGDCEYQNGGYPCPIRHLDPIFHR